MTLAMIITSRMIQQSRNKEAIKSCKSWLSHSLPNKGIQHGPDIVGSLALHKMGPGVLLAGLVRLPLVGGPLGVSVR